MLILNSFFTLKHFMQITSFKAAKNIKHSLTKLAVFGAVWSESPVNSFGTSTSPLYSETGNPSFETSISVSALASAAGLSAGLSAGLAAGFSAGLLSVGNAGKKPELVSDLASFFSCSLLVLAPALTLTLPLTFGALT